MLLAIDIGNTNVVGGIFEGSALLTHWRLATNPRRLTTRYAACARLLLEVAILTPAMTPVVAREI